MGMGLEPFLPTAMALMAARMASRFTASSPTVADMVIAMPRELELLHRRPIDATRHGRRSLAATVALLLASEHVYGCVRLAEAA